MMQCSIRLNAVAFPRPLVAGDSIALLAPAGHVKPEHVDKAALVLRQMGYKPVVYPSSYGRDGQYSAPAEERLVDLRDAFLKPGIRAVLCARGGYGVVHNLDSLAILPLEEDPKWVIGFSDITALHALMASKGIASVHASMARHVALGPGEEENSLLFDILTGHMPTYTFAPDSLNHPGEATGRLFGGNLAVMQALIATPYDLIRPGTILFIEDVDEPIYKIERILYQLHFSGVLGRLKGLLVGQFTGYKPSENFETMEEMISRFLSRYPSLPVAFNVPVGHVFHNLPLVEGAEVKLCVTPDEVTLSFLPACSESTE